MSHASHARHPVRETIAGLSLFCSTPVMAGVVVFARHSPWRWLGVAVCIILWAHAMAELVRLNPQPE